MTKLLIASHEVHATAIRDALNGKFDIHLCTDACKVAAAMKQLQPDAMVLALNMPGRDGISILSEAFAYIPPVTLVLTNFTNDHVINTCAYLGVSCILQIPCHTEYICTCLQDLLECNQGGRI